MKKVLLALLLGLTTTLCLSDEAREYKKFMKKHFPEQPLVDYSQVSRAQNAQARQQDAILKIQGVLGMGVGLSSSDRKTPVVQVFAEPGTDVTTIPSTIEGVDVEVIFMEEMKSQANMGEKISSTGTSWGTLGFRAHTVGFPEYVGFVTNNHVGAVDRSTGCPTGIDPLTYSASWGDFFQKVCSTNNTGACLVDLGGLIQVVPAMAGNSLYNTVDAAFIASSPNTVTTTVPGVGKVTNETPVTPFLGLRVQKYGARTGHTKGTITTINGVISVTAPDPVCGIGLFINQVFITGDSGDFSDTGDSGSAVWTDTSDPQLVGLLFAGNETISAANPIDAVLGSLGVVPDFNTSPPVSKDFAGIYKVLDSLGSAYGYVSLTMSPNGEDVLMYWLVTTIDGWSRTFAAQTHHTTEPWTRQGNVWAATMRTFPNIGSNQGVYAFRYDTSNDTFTVETIQCQSVYCPVGPHITGIKNIGW